MQDEFTNRLVMFKAAKTTLNEPQFKGVWFGQEPEMVGNKVLQATQALADLELFYRRQNSAITGVTQNKAREEREAVTVAYTMAGFLVEYFEAAGDENNAAKVRFSLHDLRRLRDEEAIAKMREVRDLTRNLVENDDSAIATAAAKYGITEARFLAVHKEVEEFAAVIAAPQASIAQRAALTKQLRDRFNAVEALFVSLDRLILAFDDTEAGRALIAAYQASRVIRKAGHSPDNATGTNNPNVTDGHALGNG